MFSSGWGVPGGCGVEVRICMGDVHWDTASASFDSEYAKFHSGGPKEVQNGVAGASNVRLAP